MSDTVDRVVERLEGYADGVHELSPPATVLDSEIPAAVAAVYRRFDGASLFHESLLLVASRAARVDEHGRWAIGEVEGDDLFVDAGGVVWRNEKDSGETLEEGSSFDRWLLGWVEAQAALYDEEGEFVDVFEESGELKSDVGVQFERRILKRDKKAPGPRWRLARALARLGKVGEAMDELERLVEQRPQFAWAWYDLARLSERAGELDAAADVARAAAEAAQAPDAPQREYAAFFWAHAARLYAAGGDADARAECADRALALEPELARVHREAAESCLVTADEHAALEHAELALAVAPRDLIVTELARRLRELTRG